MFARTAAAVVGTRFVAILSHTADVAAVLALRPTMGVLDGEAGTDASDTTALPVQSTVEQSPEPFTTGLLVQPRLE